MIYIALLIVVLTGWAIIKGYESRMVLFLSGLLLCILAFKPLEAFIAFYKMTITDPLVPTIVAAIAFAEAMKFTRCEEHLIRFLTKRLGNIKWILIPGTTLVTFLVNLAIISPAGCSAAVSAVAIPVLLGAGVHPAAAAAAVFAGTFGSALSPANVHNLMVSGMAQADVISIIKIHAPATIAVGILGALATYLVIRFKHEDHGYVIEADDRGDFKINPLKVLIPFLPIVLIVLASPQFNLIAFPKEYSGLSILISMMVGTLVCWAVSRLDPGNVTRAFFNGMSWGYGDIMGIVMAAAAFTAGLSAIGLTGALIEAMKNSQSIVKVASILGPFCIGILSGSGDAATIAFNQAVTPHAAEFGMTIGKLGSVANIAGAVGRTMSPVAGACIAAAAIAKVNPLEAAKRTAPGMLLATLVIYFVMY